MEKAKDERMIKRWRVIAMLTYIKTHIHSPNILNIIDNYINFTNTLDKETKKNDGKSKQQTD